MPPKSSKNKSRAHPYEGGDRRSARQAELATSREDAVQVSEQQVSHPDNNGPNLPSTSTGITHSQTSATTSTCEQVPMPPTSSCVNSGEPHVSRQEFQELRDNVASIKSIMSSFFSTFNPNSQGSDTQNPSTGANSSVQGSQIPVLISGPGSDSPINRFARGVDAVDQVVQQAVSQHVQSITQDVVIGKPLPETPSMQIDRKVSPKLMLDIWENKYVEFLDLIDKKDDTYQPLQLVINDAGEQQWVPIKANRQITNIGQWSRAFDIYLAVYTRKYPEQIHNLLAYATKVKDLAYSNGDYIRYDREFRISRARYNVPWETPNLELWYQCSQSGFQAQLDKVVNLVKNQDQSFLATNNTSSDNTNNNISQSNKPKLRHPTGACFNFHNKGKCPRANCRFSHACYAPGCNQEHPAYSCPLLTKPDNNTLSKASGGAGASKSSSSNSDKAQ